MPRKPTLKQERAFALVAETGRSVSGAMRDVGYSPMSATRPAKLTDSDGWKQLIDEYLPEKKILERAREGLDAWKIHSSHTEPDVKIPDFATQHKYVATGLELRGRLKPDNIINNFQVIVPINITRGEDRSQDDSPTPQAI